MRMGYEVLLTRVNHPERLQIDIRTGFNWHTYGFTDRPAELETDDTATLRSVKLDDTSTPTAVQYKGTWYEVIKLSRRV